jgi:hypothetical protein
MVAHLFWCAKIRSSQREVPVLRLRTCTFVVRPSRGTGKSMLCFGIEDETRKGRAVGILRRRWFQIFVSGLILLYLIELTLVATSNAKYVPGILLGAFLVPITFVTYLYEDRVG